MGIKNARTSSESHCLSSNTSSTTCWGDDILKNYLISHNCHKFIWKIIIGVIINPLCELSHYLDLDVNE